MGELLTRIALQRKCAEPHSPSVEDQYELI